MQPTLLLAPLLLLLSVSASASPAPDPIDAALPQVIALDRNGNDACGTRAGCPGLTAADLSSASTGGAGRPSGAGAGMALAGAGVVLAGLV
ncbi:hypothetical protein GLOTRDRAFT_138806 [Gloeophyllum trabeum ATCC 11539]|uniref:Uncharacterized protein n=1 Tax=Gloeophyllum trabeum (strain ATCC 11539 / FP-39264 / Madison 617) TaxID=670483 RepID=S7RLA5_GLOTA|nr:uncharacterized protein GLOTRDRAFT_138806 [Gloeophyllum trabeum ATCC 11539]EPQ55170.1 hypothetical protein GLOTRDRAFT_138806 [Gloeophyllum trabeum ATCC 11539]